MAAKFGMYGSVQITPSWTDGTAKDSLSVNVPLSLNDGTGADQADGYWSKTYTLGPGDTETINLLGLPKTLFGTSGTVDIWKVKALLVQNLSDRTAFTVGGSPSDRWEGFTDGTLAVGAGGLVLVTAPVDGLETASTAKNFVIENTDQVYTLTGNTTASATAVTALSSTASLKAGMLVSGTGIPTGAKIATITSGTAITLTAAATAAGTGTSLTFQNPDADVLVVVVGVLD